MSISRAFTTRRVKQSLDLRDSADGIVGRSNTSSMKPSKMSNSFSSIRNKISAPVKLVSTTNMLSYNAPDIYPKAATPSTSTTRSDDDSDSAPSIISTPPTSPDSPHPRKRTPEPELNHLSCYFTAPGQTNTVPTPGDAPVIPQRAPSHTKKHSQDVLSRQRSDSRMSEQSSTASLSSKASFSFSRSSSASTNTSVASHSSASYSKAPPRVSLPSHTTPMVPLSHRRDPSAAAHPFGHELAQVSELAEEFSAKETSFQSQHEEREILSQGFRKFNAQDYLSEVQELYTVFFGEDKSSRQVWI